MMAMLMVRSLSGPSSAAATEPPTPPAGPPANPRLTAGRMLNMVAVAHAVAVPHTQAAASMQARQKQPPRAQARIAARPKPLLRAAAWVTGVAPLGMVACSSTSFPSENGSPSGEAHEGGSSSNGVQAQAGGRAAAADTSREDAQVRLPASCHNSSCPGTGDLTALMASWLESSPSLAQFLRAGQDAH